ncbi:hypothetical protein EDD22DRAFT_781892 [Suillus occidentalis]|nr:hypothetical protein EDD22DRAFT_781892 [Suillus occidentalis]
MLLDQASEGSTAGENHPYLYARVLGIYHVNATYIGPGMVDYRSHRIDFLWVHWYRHLGKHSQASRQASLSLDHVCFPPIGEQDSFGFIDPDDVLRCCHVIPHFAQGLQHLDGRGISLCAQDQLDWKSYYINCFVDRDSFMRYQWGLGVGHTYAHSAGGQEDVNAVVVEDFEDFEDGDLDVPSCGQGCAPSDSDSGGEASDSDSDSGSTSDDSNSGGCEADSDSDQYSILDYEN